MEKKNKIIGSRLLGFFRRCEKKPLANFQRSCPKWIDWKQLRLRDDDFEVFKKGVQKKTKK
jgi:hypothetical protein